MRYIAGETNHCPGCGRSQWLVGRITAECAFCGSALPLAHDHERSSRLITFGKGGGRVARMVAA